MALKYDKMSRLVFYQQVIIKFQLNISYYKSLIKKNCFGNPVPVHYIRNAYYAFLM